MLFILLSLFALSCAQKPVCYNEANKNQIIRWGKYFVQEDKFDAYELTSNANISQFTQGNKSDIFDLGQADLHRYCNVVRSVRANLLKTQTYSTPGDTLYFIEFENHDMELSMRFSWNIHHVNKGNKLCIAAMDSLNALLGTIK